MRQGSIVILLWILFFSVPSVHSAEEIRIKIPAAFQDIFHENSIELGFPEGRILQLGCLIEAVGSPIKEVRATNIATGEVLIPSPLDVGNAWSGLYLVYPFPTFDPEKHQGVWEILVLNEKGQTAMAKTHKLEDHGPLPFIEGIKATGNPLAPLINWTAVDGKDIPEKISIKYQIRLLTNIKNQFYKSEEITTTTHKIPEGLIQAENLSKTYLRVDILGYDKTDSVHSYPFEVSARTFISMEAALRNH